VGGVRNRNAADALAAAGVGGGGVEDSRCVGLTP